MKFFVYFGLLALMIFAAFVYEYLPNQEKLLVNLEEIIRKYCERFEAKIPVAEASAKLPRKIRRK